MTKRDTCATGGALTAGPAPPTCRAGASDLELHGARATRIAGYALYRTDAAATCSGWAWNWSLFRDRLASGRMGHTSSAAGLGGCTGLGDGTVSAASRVSEPGSTSAGSCAYADCNPAGLSGGERADS